MSETPDGIQFTLAEFDRSHLPESRRAEFRQTVQEHLAAQFSVVSDGGR